MKIIHSAWQAQCLMKLLDGEFEITNKSVVEVVWCFLLFRTLKIPTTKGVAEVFL